MVVLVAKILPVLQETLCSSAVWKRFWGWNQFPEKKTGILSDFSNIFMIWFLIPAHSLVGSFSIDDGDGSENVTFKMNSRFSFQTLSRIFRFAKNVKCRRISLELIYWRPHSSLQRGRNIRRRLFTSSIKREIRNFSRSSRAVTVKKCTKKCDARLKLLIC